MHSYSTSVALFDFVPVLISAVALLFLAQGISHRHRGLAPVAWAAALLIPVGGLCKASWKLLVATQGLHLDWLENLLFVALAPGFVAMAFCLFHALRAWQAGQPGQHLPASRLAAWLSFPVIGGLLLAAAFPEQRWWFFWLLAVTTVANICLIVHAIRAARWSGLGWSVSASFVLSFTATLTLSGLSRLPDTEASAWLQESVNLTAQLTLAYGFWHLKRRMQEQDIS